MAKLKKIIKKVYKQGFTLVELIVVITILAILGTIAFISYQGYSRDSRDSKRIADINSIQKSLEIYIIQKGTYPIPDEFANITYSGATAWIEGTVGDKVIVNLDKINKKPLDPLTGNEYTYSITSGKTEYQIGAISEGGQMGYKLPINQTHAADKSNTKAMIRGTYNERFLKVQSGTLNWILALPSIIATDITTPEIQTILDEEKLVYNNYANIPHSYNDYGYTMTGGFDYTNTNPLIYSGSTKILAENNNEKLIFIDNLKQAYNGTILQGDPNYQDIVNTDTENNQTGAINLINNFINTNIGGIKSGNFTLPTTQEIPPIQPTYNCTGTLVTANATITNNTGLTTTTNYQTTNNANKCYYECTSGYTGTDCETLITYTVTFDATGGTGNTPTTKTVDYNTAAGTLPTPPTKVGYIFNGWFTQITGGTELTTNTIISANITYYAQWSASTNTIVFNGNGNTGGATANQTLATNATANLTSNGYTKTGYTFAGWSTSAGGVVEYTNGESYTMGTSSVTLYAQRTVNIYTVSGGFGSSANGATINVCGTNVTADSSGNFTSTRNYGDTCNTITAERTGYTCNTTTNGPASLTSNTTNIAGSCTLNTYTVSGGFGANANGATINVCGTNTTASSTGTFTTTRNYGDVCNNITATRTGYTCSTTTNGPASLTANTTNIAGSCTLIPPAFLSNCTANGQFIYTDATGNEIGRVNNVGTTTLGTPGNLTCAGHIIVCSGNNAGYTLQACNLGSSTVGATNTVAAYGLRYQFGKSDNSWVNGSAGYSYDWKSPGGTNIGSANDWGVLDTNKTTATWSNSDSTSRTKMQGPCPANYHVPTNAEWVAINTAGGWGATLGTNLSNTLKLPLAGDRLRNDGSMYNNGSYGLYWASSPYSTSGYNVTFGYTYVNPSDYYYRSYGLSLRCLKN